MATKDSLPDGIKVRVCINCSTERDIYVKKLGLGRYAEMLEVANRLLEKMFTKAISDIDTADTNVSEKDFLASLVLSISNYREDVFKMIHIASYDRDTKSYQLSLEELEEDIGLEEAIELITAAIEVNRIFETFDGIKKVKATIQGIMKQKN